MSQIIPKNTKNRNRIIKWRSDLIIKRDDQYKGYYEFIIISFIILLISKSLKLNNEIFNLDKKKEFLRCFSLKNSLIDSIDNLFVEAGKDERTIEYCVLNLKNTILNSTTMKDNISQSFLKYFVENKDINKNDIFSLRKIFIGFGYSPDYFLESLRSQILIKNNDPFMLFNISKNVSHPDLKFVYKKIVKKYHPDSIREYHEIPELIEVLKEQFIIYNNAYTQIAKKRKFRN